MTIKTSVFLIIDYNLARVAEVAHMSDYARRRYHVDTLLIRANPGEHDKRLCDHVIALDPRSPVLSMPHSRRLPRGATLCAAPLCSRTMQYSTVRHCWNVSDCPPTPPNLRSAHSASWNTDARRLGFATYWQRSAS